MLFNIGDQIVGGLRNRFQTGFQFRQGLIFGPCGNIAQTVSAGVDIPEAAYGERNRFRFDFHRVLILFLGRLPVRIASSRGKPVFLPVVELGVGDLMNGGAYGLHLAHTFPNSNGLVGKPEKAVCSWF